MYELLWVVIGITIRQALEIWKDMQLDELKHRLYVSEWRRAEAEAQRTRMRRYRAGHPPSGKDAEGGRTE